MKLVKIAFVVTACMMSVLAAGQRSPAAAEDDGRRERRDHVHGVTALKHRVATAEIMLIGLTLSHYGATRDWPGPTPGVVKLSYLEEYFVPDYLEQLPTEDPWGNPYLFWSDSNYTLIVSFGSDDTPDVDYGHLVGQAAEQIKTVACRGRSDDPTRDVVWFDVNFCQTFDGDMAAN